ncbi:hypothetical protein D9619_010028 [Psilocybe cf. subviscida]|uniref:Uncharacterized protein n=1 Tax=Psilocybe cf. subviscida TaxID=2480587 RepID=A0A8H5F646_9AGAR|nr:hypothetical protein D9619_010028 [Psilocybe cf. subviscida]
MASWLWSGAAVLPLSLLPLAFLSLQNLDGSRLTFTFTLALALRCGRVRPRPHPCTQQRPAEPHRTQHTPNAENPARLKSDIAVGTHDWVPVLPQCLPICRPWLHDASPGVESNAFDDALAALQASTAAFNATQHGIFTVYKPSATYSTTQDSTNT